MRQLLALLLAVVFTGVSFAQEFVLSGEAKTGIIWKQTENRLAEGVDSKREGDGVRMGSMDDAGSFDGRLRLNVKYTNTKGNLGFQARLNWDQFNNAPTNGPNWSYGYGWGSFFDDQFVLSLGKLGNSPWGSGGPEMWRELEVSSFAGLRFEWKPKFVQSWENGEMNLGFVLNWYDEVADTGMEREATLLDALQESVIGLAYKNNLFLVRTAFRFDSALDQGGARSGVDIDREGQKFVYRVEEYVLEKMTPAIKLKIWALGEFIGFGSSSPDDTFTTRNWLFFQVTPGDVTAQARFGYEASGVKTHMFIRPFVSYKLFGGLLVPSIEATYANDFGEHKIWEDSAYLYIDIKPRLQMNFAQGAYVAFEYYYKVEMVYPFPGPPEKYTQWMNLRAGISF